MTTYDVAIVGSGIVGAMTAIKLAQKTSLKIGVIEAAKQANQIDQRVSAISLGSKKIFQQINCFEAIQSKKITPFNKMHVWDANGNGKIDFDCEQIQSASLGYIIEDRIIRTSLMDCYSGLSNIEFLCPMKLRSVRETSDYIECSTDDNITFRAKLLIAADGANSVVRDKLGFELQERDYEHTAIVTTVTTEYFHQSTAWQCFLGTGPLAFLPLNDEKSCSIVWSATHAYANKLLSLNDDEFKKTLGVSFANRLGEIIHVTNRLSFPLRMRHAKSYVRNRVALIGDAAHTIHPLVGQGVNLGLRDASSLADVIISAYNKKRDFTSLHTLRRYERERKADTLVMLTLVDILKRLFASENKSVKRLRNIGLNMTNQMAWIKDFLITQATNK